MRSGVTASDRSRPAPFALAWLPAALATALLGWCTGAAAVPPPPEQGAADCVRPTYASDQLVCADPALRALDRRMVALMGRVSTAAPASALHGFEPQSAWFRRRSRCAFSERHAACLRAAYRERIDLLSALAGLSTGEVHQAVRMSCPGAPWGNGPVRLVATGRSAFTLDDGLGRVLVVASTLEPGDDWSPFLRLVRESGGIRFASSEGGGVDCTPV